ncbi:AraC family ligand binding domain-containing protein, partial [Kibdelosporangium lantanae]
MRRTTRPGPATYTVVLAPGELPVASWHLPEHGWDAVAAVEEHAHDFPILAYFDKGTGVLRSGQQVWHIEEGDLFVVAPGDVMGRMVPEELAGAQGWGTFFTA